MTELFPYLRRSHYSNMLVWVGLDETKAPDGQIPNFACRHWAVNWAINHKLLPRDTNEKDIVIKERGK